MPPSPDLFAHALAAQPNSETPLASRMRPRTLDDFIGTGKTTRAKVKAQTHT